MLQQLETPAGDSNL